MSSTGPDMTHDDADMVLACPGCDRAGQLRHREDGVVKCYNCGGESDPSEVVERPDERGLHTPTEANARGGRKAETPSDEFMRMIAKKGGRAPKNDISNL